MRIGAPTQSKLFCENDLRPALLRLLADIKSGKVQIVVVYKVDRLKRRVIGKAEHTNGAANLRHHPSEAPQDRWSRSASAM